MAALIGKRYKCKNWAVGIMMIVQSIIFGAGKK